METMIELTEDELDAVVGGVSAPTGESVTITFVSAISGTNVGLSGTFKVVTTPTSSTVFEKIFEFSLGPVRL